MAVLSLHVLPKEVDEESRWEEYVHRTKPLRLRSLKEDRKSFVSKYESEVKEPLSFWVGRLKDPKAWTVVMVSSPGELADDKDALLQADVTWVAFCVMIDPDASGIEDEASKSERKDHSDWFMAAVWLSPEFRGQGAGKRLVHCGIDTARKADTDRGIVGRRCKTQVVKGNEGAIELYKKIGFGMTDADASVEKDGVKYQSYELTMTL